MRNQHPIGQLHSHLRLESVEVLLNGSIMFNLLRKGTYGDTLHTHKRLELIWRAWCIDVNFAI